MYTSNPTQIHRQPPTKIPNARLCRSLNHTHGVIRSKLQVDMGAKRADEELYQSLVGLLIFLANTRPNIAFAVRCLSYYMLAPRIPHLEAAKRVLGYINLTSNHDIFLFKGLLLSAYVDVDWARDMDRRKLTVGLLFKLGDSPIQMSNKHRSTIALSLTKVEYRGSVDSWREIVWLRALLTEIWSDYL